MKKTAWPAVFSIVCFCVYFALGAWGRHGFVSEEYMNYLLAFCYGFLGIAFVRLCTHLIFDVMYFRRTGREAPDLLRIMFSLVAYSIVGTIILASVLKYNVTGLLATSAALSVVIGLALQDTLGNFFAGAALHIERSFKIKDSIKFGERAGEVESVSWRTTTVRTTDNSFLIFPNSLLARDLIEVFPYDGLHQHKVEFSASYSLSPRTVMDTAKKVLRDLEDVSCEVQPEVRIARFAESSVDYQALFWMKNYMKVVDVKALFRERLWYAFYRDGIDMPFPARHVLFERVKPGRRPQAICMPDYRCIIDGIDIFQSLTRSEKDALVARNNVRIYAPGECMVRRGEDGESMFVIGRGKAEVRVSANGTHSTVAVLETGSYFGEMSLFSGEPRSADVVALEEAEVLEIQKPSIQALLDENKSLAETFSKKVTERLAGLERYADSEEQETILVEEKHLLDRIKNFFNLSG